LKDGLTHYYLDPEAALHTPTEEAPEIARSRLS
jgi:hypothetical protein